MYHEEKIIGGVLCWRGSPNAKFEAYTIEQLSHMYLDAKTEIRELKEFFELEKEE